MENKEKVTPRYYENEEFKSRGEWKGLQQNRLLAGCLAGLVSGTCDSISGL